MHKKSALAVIDGVRQVCKSGSILHEPIFIGQEVEYLADCIKSTFVSSVGPYVDKFEQLLTEYTGAYAVAVVNGTCGLHLALHTLGVNAEHEVLVPSITFVASVNAICQTGAQPHFIDCGFPGHDKAHVSDYGVDIALLQAYLYKIAKVSQGQTINRNTGKVIKAIMPVHVFGHAVEMDALLDLVQQFPMAVVEDAAEALGSFYKKRHLGSLGDIGVISFNGNKTITTGGGGMVLTENAMLAQRLRFLSTTAKTPHPWLYQHPELGFNYRMPNINAALGCAQFAALPEILQRKRSLLKMYETVFAQIPDVRLIKEPAGTVSNYWLHNIQLLNGLEAQRDFILNELHNCKIGVRPLWEPLHTLEYLRRAPSMDLANSMALAQCTLSLPSGAGLVG